VEQFSVVVHEQSESESQKVENRCFSKPQMHVTFILIKKALPIKYKLNCHKEE